MIINDLLRQLIEANSNKLPKEYLDNGLSGAETESPRPGEALTTKIRVLSWDYIFENAPCQLQVIFDPDHDAIKYYFNVHEIEEVNKETWIKLAQNLSTQELIENCNAKGDESLN